MSCSVYDASLLGKGPMEANGGGNSAGASQSGTAGEASPAAGGGAAGKSAVNGGSSGEGSGGGGMTDAAGAPDTGGQGNEGGTAGNGTAGRGGTAGGGTAGEGAGGGMAGEGAVGGGTGGGGVAGSGGSGGSAAGAGTGGASSATGCAKLSVPLDGQNDRAHFVISLPSAVNLSATTASISMRVYVQAGVGGTVFNYVQDSQPRFFGLATGMRPLLSSISGWQTLTFNVGALADTASPAIVKSDIRRIGIEINAAPSTAWSNPTILYVDSITVLPPALSFTFDTASTVTATPSGTDVSGQVLWLHNGTSDTTATGSTLSWQATCP